MSKITMAYTEGISLLDQDIHLTNKPLVCGFDRYISSFSTLILLNTYKCIIYCMYHNIQCNMFNE